MNRLEWMIARVAFRIRDEWFAEVCWVDPVKRVFHRFRLPMSGSDVGMDLKDWPFRFLKLEAA